MTGSFNPRAKSSTALSDKNFWATSRECFQDATALYGRKFELDICAEPKTAKCSLYYSIQDGNDALALPWADHWWCNPPFDNKFSFIKKAFIEAQKGFEGMMLLPYEPATQWWHQMLGKGVIVYEPDGRYNFLERDGVTKKKGVNFPSAFVLFPAFFIPHTIKIPFKKGVAHAGGYDLI